MSDAEQIGALQTQVQNFQVERTEAAQTICALLARIAVLEQANQVLTRQLLDKCGFTALRVDGRIVVMGRN